MRTNKCRHCGEIKPLNKFVKDEDYKLNVSTTCYKCHYKMYGNGNIENKPRFAEYRKKYNRSINGYLRNLYHNIKIRLKNSKSYQGRCLEFSQEWFMEYAKKSTTFNLLFQNWEKHNYHRKLSPSVDRIDNSKGYLKTNIQFLTTHDNAKKFIN